MSYSPNLLQKRRPCKMRVREALRVSKEGRGMASSHSCPCMPPTATPPPRRHPPCRLDAGKRLCCVPGRLRAEAQKRAVGTRGSPSPSPDPGRRGSSPAQLLTSVSGVQLGKIYVPLRFGNRSHTKTKEERERERNYFNFFLGPEMKQK